MFFIPSFDVNFPFEEAEKLYNENKKYFLPFDSEFKALCRGLNGNVWAVMGTNLMGIIYFELKGGKWFLSGYSKRKVYKYVPEAIQRLCEQYYERWGINEIYSETPHKHSKLALLRAGFKHVKDNIYRKEK